MNPEVHHNAVASRFEAAVEGQLCVATYRMYGKLMMLTHTGVPTALVRGDVFFWQSLQAATILVAAPIAAVFTLFLDRCVAGFTMGAVKG